MNLIDLINVQFILIDIRTYLTLLLICKLFISQRAWRQNKYGGSAHHRASRIIQIKLIELINIRKTLTFHSYVN